MTKSVSNNTTNRPLSPHLTIYRPQLNSVLSILHRITGIVLIFGLMLITGWFFSMSLGEMSFKFYSLWINTLIGKLIMFGSLCALWYHFFAGIRHLFWDFGIGFNLSTVKRSSYAVLLGTGFFIILSLILDFFT